MVKTYYFNAAPEFGGLKEALTALYAGVDEDFNGIDYTEWMLKELDDLTTFHGALFAGQESPDGRPWKPNAKSTIRAKGHARILRGKRKGSSFANFPLARSLVERHKKSTANAVREAIQTDRAAYLAFGTTLPYSAVNQEGNARIPARPHVGINERYLEGMAITAADYTIEQLAKM